MQIDVNKNENRKEEKKTIDKSNRNIWRYGCWEAAATTRNPLPFIAGHFAHIFFLYIRKSAGLIYESPFDSADEPRNQISPLRTMWLWPRLRFCMSHNISKHFIAIRVARESHRFGIFGWSGESSWSHCKELPADKKATIDKWKIVFSHFTIINVCAIYSRVLVYEPFVITDSQIMLLWPIINGDLLKRKENPMRTHKPKRRA